MSKGGASMTSAQRARWIVVISTVVLLLCVTRLFYIQIVRGPSLAEEGQVVRTSVSEVAAKRGSIVDANGLVLADSVQTYHVAVNQVNVAKWRHYEDQTQPDGTTKSVLVGKGPAEAAKQLAPLLDMDPVELGGKMVGTHTYVYLKKNVDAVTYRKIRELGIYGIEWESVFQRTYPNGNTAAPLIGTVNESGEGSSGLEATFDALLQGTPGKEAFEIAPNGAIMPGGKQTTQEPQDGATITTTIRGDLQHAVQEVLDARVTQHEAEWGAVVITDVATGKVLVMADSGSQSPDNAAPQTVRSVQYAFEPGSVGKVITMATALEKGSVTPTSVFTVPYALDVEGEDLPITDFHEHDTQQLTATGILAESSNTGTVLIGETVSDQDRFDMMHALGLGQPTGIELAGESEGLVRTPDQWLGRDRYVTMFGQAYMMTALQEAGVMATIGNGGVRMAPRLVDSWTLPDGTVHQPDPVEPVQAMSSTTASTLLRMMESTVDTEQGTGQMAKVEGYRLAVKTGTAEIPGGTVSTVAGIVPADAPRLAVSVVLYNPKVGWLSSDSAAPLFAEAVTQAVRNLAVPASSGAADLYPSTPGQ
ncbi:MAG: penicillin-binding protein 2 [Propionibacterium sp.]|nr:penicillin-binding protein 2 [Propionibacterium sp.]